IERCSPIWRYTTRPHLRRSRSRPKRPWPEPAIQAKGRRETASLFCLSVRSKHMDDLARIVDSALAEFAGCGDPAALENAKARYLGKSGALTEQLKSLGRLPAGER